LLTSNQSVPVSGVIEHKDNLKGSSIWLKLRQNSILRLGHVGQC